MPDDALLVEALEGLPLVMRRGMFGHPAAFAAGQIFAVVGDEDRICVRLPEEKAFAEAMALPGAGGFDPGHDGKPMRHWVLLPATMLDEPRELAEWVKRAHALALKEPPKPRGRPKPAPTRRRRS